ncbi:uncharacterized protein DUF4360 [Actinomadura pelletieri DSM 43383]|uniref:Uncharacterized protein DUF4360 n=1 Tax=Actinomadura pelletieri DSM 43383 TaxID=1120940 RepID=A0A495QXN5_9ACTN|nr:DUF4360 domain-containing protein [Actinomadura pelletieri]RKS78883.1 uncharacterized protein DUF4360 [Actinomadura pelletieri DSM 43383]
MRERISGVVVAAAALAAAAVAATPAAAGTGPDRGPDPPVVWVDEVSGSGCPKDSVAANLSQDRDALLLTYSDFKAAAGGSAQPADRRKDCRVTVRTGSPQGYSYAIRAADHRGTALLEKGAAGRVTVDFGFENQPSSGQDEHTFHGPYDDNWQITLNTPEDELVFTPCGENPRFVVNTELRAIPGTDKTKTSFISMDTFDGSIKSTYHLVRKRCP